PLFGVPNPPIDRTDHAIGILAASLVKDGGSLQLGIGSLGDAVVHWLRVRHAGTADFADALDGVTQRRWGDLVRREGGIGIFSRGLFASSEMFSWGLLTLLRAGVIRRRADDGKGPALQAAFFLGPNNFYDALREMSEPERDLLRMKSVLRINDLYGEEQWLRQQLRDARFINICMKVTLTGAAASDGLADGRVVSGVGGQYNFVAMAHELEGARSILLLRSTHEHGTHVESNIVFNYAHTTIPRHLRDIVVTEYGIADLRGCSDAEVASALIAIADARFQDDLTNAAKHAGKLPRTWRIPEAARTNTPERLGERMELLAARRLLPLFPLGTEFDDVEQRLIAALRWLKTHTSSWRGRFALGRGMLTARSSSEQSSALARMGLAAPHNMKEKILQRLVTLGLNRSYR
ncbi:MAG TPA: acetyl-CoA hydrolase/transferase C-terminal domain-containing protein, partial [Burkholderiales bacterium]|nr:acetyl-CoA hydrolase/transferase C-terminal domain-containing protein [Burkholderiales bacterium]